MQDVKNMQYLPKNQMIDKKFKPIFEQKFSVSIPEWDRSDLFRWQNVQFTGKEIIPLSKDVPKELQDAAWHMTSCSLMIVKFKVNKNGDKFPLSLRYGGIEYNIIKKYERKY